MNDNDTSIKTRRNNARNLALVLALVAAAVFGVSIYQQSERQFAKGLGKFEKDREAFANLGGDFRLTTTRGATSLSELWTNKVVLLYFGFTRCPDICPTSLAAMQAALGRLTPQERDQIQVVFVSADPEYDTPDRLQQYLEHFVTDSIGMTGDLDATLAAAKSYGAYFHKVELPDSALGYTVDHSTRWYLIQKNGRIGTVFDHNLSPEQIAEILGVFARDAA